MEDWEQARADGDVLRAFELLQKRIEECAEPAGLVRLLTIAARMQLEELHDPYAAMEMFEQVLDFEPSDSSALDSLEVIYEAVEDWPRMVELLERRDELALDPSKRIELQLRIAILAEEILEDRPRACSAYEAILTIDPDHPSARSGLDRLRH